MVKWLGTDPVNTTLDSLSKIAQVTAFVIAGLWAFWSYFTTVRPTLERHVNANSELKWIPSTESGSCKGVLVISLENKGIRGFDVRSYRVQGWLFRDTMPVVNPGSESLSKAGTDSPIALDYGRVAQGLPFYDMTFTKTGNGSSEELIQTNNRTNITVPHSKENNVLLAHYPTATGLEDSYDWLFKRVEGQGVLFIVHFYTADKSDSFIPPLRAQDDVCASVASTTPLKLSSTTSLSPQTPGTR